MPNPVWPAALPQKALKEGYRETASDNLLESQMDAGPAKIRRRFTTRSRMFQMTIACTASQAATFLSFFETTLKDGSLPFDWVHPRTGAAATFRFRKPVPQIVPRGGGHVDITLNLEMLG